jgi:hypothetical protein
MSVIIPNCSCVKAVMTIIPSSSVWSVKILFWISCANDTVSFLCRDCKYCKIRRM